MIEFDSIESFMRFLSTRPEAMHAAGADGVEMCTIAVQQGAKDALGTYQGGFGPFPAWADLALATIEERLRLGYTGNDPELRSGALRDNIERSADRGALAGAVGVPDVMVGDGSEANPFRNIGQVAEEQELGHGVPERSFLGLTAARLAGPIVDTMCGPVVAALCGQAAPRQLISPEADEIPF